MTIKLSNYLFFSTTCEQALAFYTQCGLGRVTEMMRYGENGMPVENEEMRGKIMHAQFEGSGVLFYASDNDLTFPAKSEDSSERWCYDRVDVMTEME